MWLASQASREFLPLVAFATCKGTTVLKTVEGVVCCSFNEVCFRLNLFEDDSQYHLAMQEASVSSSAASLWSRFAMLLT